MPVEVVQFVLDRLRDYDGPLLEGAENEALRMQRVLERLGFNDPEEAGEHSRRRGARRGGMMSLTGPPP